MSHVRKLGMVVRGEPECRSEPQVDVKQEVSIHYVCRVIISLTMGLKHVKSIHNPYIHHNRSRLSHVSRAHNLNLLSLMVKHAPMYSVRYTIIP